MARIPLPLLLTAVAGLIPLVAGHAAFFHPSMWGFNVTAQTFPYDNRPVAPLTEYTFDQWWFHGHLDYPPNDGDIFELPAGQPVTTQIACDKGATTFFASDPGGDIQNGDDPCPGSPPSEYHTTGFDDLKGCALAITYKSNVSDVQPEDFTVFSVNQTCVWYRFTDFQVPARMPACPEGGCICAWLWIHSPDSGGEQNYMNGFRCNVTGATSDVALATPQVPRRCGADLDNGRVDASFSNCTWGAKQPFYWLQQERNNMFEGYYSPPFYTNLYNFLDGAQQDIFQDSYPNGLPTPVVNGTVPVPNFVGVQPTATPSAPSGLPFAIVGTPAPVATATSSAGAGGGGTTTSGTANSPSSSIQSTASAASTSASVDVTASSTASATDAVSVSVVISTVVSTEVVTVTAAPASVTATASSVVLSVVSGIDASSSTLSSSSAISASSSASSTPPSSSSSESASASLAIPSSSSAASILPATSTLLLNAPSPSLIPDVNIASATASSSTSSPTGLRCAARGSQANSKTRRVARRSTKSGLQDVWEAMKPGLRRRDADPGDNATDSLVVRGARAYRPAHRSRLWRVF